MALVFVPCILGATIPFYNVPGSELGETTPKSINSSTERSTGKEGQPSYLSLSASQASIVFAPNIEEHPNASVWIGPGVDNPKVEEPSAADLGENIEIASSTTTTSTEAPKSESTTARTSHRGRGRSRGHRGNVRYTAENALRTAGKRGYVSASGSSRGSLSSTTTTTTTTSTTEVAENRTSSPTSESSISRDEITTISSNVETSQQSSEGIEVATPQQPSVVTEEVLPPQASEETETITSQQAPEDTGRVTSQHTPEYQERVILRELPEYIEIVRPQQPTEDTAKAIPEPVSASTERVIPEETPEERNKEAAVEQFPPTIIIDEEKYDARPGGDFVSPSVNEGFLTTTTSRTKTEDEIPETGNFEDEAILTIINKSPLPEDGYAVINRQ